MDGTDQMWGAVGIGRGNGMGWIREKDRQRNWGVGWSGTGLDGT